MRLNVRSQCRMCFLLLLFCLPFGTALAQKDERVTITSPVDGSGVGEQQTVSGTVGELRSGEQGLYVLIRAFGWGGWWVQPKPDISQRKWVATCYFGRPADIKQDFGIVAIITSSDLREGAQYASLPQHSAISKIVTVHR